MIGTVVSHYKILEKLGEGGMGIVYKAEDTKLKRTVALKFLPQRLETYDQERARFLQEAQAASALNHPNICTIHDLQESAGQYFIVMECVEGKTLRQLIPVPKLQDAIGYAIQIGEALQEAHSKGVIHRDVKTDNIMVNSRNQVKVMDFGLAKLKGSIKLTRTSSTVGTLAYMAPEQIQGGEVDARSDIFSYGVVLYELLTGHLPFDAMHEAAMMYAILNEAPKPVQQYLPSISSELIHILNRSLEKDPEDRYQTVHDMVIDLRRVKKETSRVSPVHITSPVAEREMESAAETQRPTPKVSERKKPRKVLLWIGIAVLLTATAFYFVVLRTRIVQMNPDMKFKTLQISFSQISYPSLSADGNWMAFPAADANVKWDVYYMNVSVGDPHRVTFDSSANPNGNANADISPDGGLIAYCRYNPKIRWYDAYVVPSIGGRSKIIVENCVGVRWRPDGSRIGYFLGRGERTAIWSINPDGSDPRQEVSDTLIGIGSGRIAFDWAPDGNALAYLRTFTAGYQEIVRGDLKTGEETQLTYDKKNIDEVCWSSNNQIIFSSNKSGNTNLWMIPASGGQSIQITKGSGPDIGMSISAEGKKILYLQSQQVGHLWRGSTDGHATRQLTTEERNINWPSFSPDGKFITFSMSDNDPLKSTSHIYVCDRDGNNRQQITTGDVFAEWPTWSPDGKWIAYYAGQSSDSAIVYIVDQADSRLSRPMGRGLFSKWIDPTTIVITNPFRGTGSIVTLDGRSTSVTYKDSVNLWPLLDGRNVLLWDSHIGKEGWYVVASKNNQVIEGAKPKKLLTQRHAPNLSPDKKYFYYSVESEILRRISIPEGKDEHIPGTFPGLGFLFSISSDGKEIVYNDSRVNAKLVIIENLFK